MLAINQSDPTRTVTLRRRFTQMTNAMWERVFRRLRSYLRNEPLLLSREQRVTAFNRFLRQVIDEESRGLVDRTQGFESLLRAAYLRGIRFAISDARALGLVVDAEPQQEVRHPDHQEEFALLFLLLLSDWDGIKEETIKQLQRVYGVGILADLGESEIERQSHERINKIGKTRSSTMGHSYVVEGVAAGTLTALGLLGVEFVGVEPEFAFWQTAGDERVCPICVEGTTANVGFGPGIYPLERARELVPAHARCRCRLVAARPTRDA